jgi:viologen exporter family transport system permease protein
MYRAFAASAFQTQLVYRAQLWASLFGDLFQVLAAISIWVAVYSGRSDVGGVTLRDMITYSILASLLFAWNWPRFVNLVGQQIKSGDVTVFLLKPLSYPLMLLGGECGNLAHAWLTRVVPITLLLGAIYGIQPPASVFHGLLAVIFLLVGFLMLFSMALIAGLIAFWLMSVFALEWILRSLITFLAGSIIPLWFYPPAIRPIVEALPFSFVAYHPMAVYLGKLDVAATLSLLLLGLGWLAFFTGMAAWLWHRARLRLVVQGG